MLPIVNETARKEISVCELVVGVKCGSSDGFSGISCSPALGNSADKSVRSNGTVLITEIPEFCGAEHILRNDDRKRDRSGHQAFFEQPDF